jgi:TolB-like protein
MLGQTLGPYRVQDKLGAGGMGEVYRAYDPRLEREVALKVLPASSFADAAARARLLREARSAAGLNHPNICTIYDVGEADGQAYIAMELVIGETLSTRLSRGPLPVDELLRYALQLAEALAHAHERGVVHRDLKCANVVLTADGRAKVLDFGLAKRMLAAGDEEATESQATFTKPGTVMGTLAYMAPEQLRGEPVDMRCDIWALGIVLYEMAAGDRPFRGNTGYELSSSILSQPPRPLSLEAPAVLRAVIERCLEKEPGRRYQRAGEVRAALEAPLATAAASATEHRRGGGRRASRWAPAAGLALVAVLAVVGWRLFLARPAAPKISSLVVLPLANLSGDPSQDFFADGMTEALISELSQIGGLGVVSRTSAMQYKGTHKPLRQIVSELGVDGAIEGGVLREGQEVRVSINLVNGRSDKTLWAQSFDREAAGLLTLYGDVARAIASQVEVSLSPQEQALLSHTRRVDPDAYEDYLKGRMYWFKQTPFDVDRALRYFQQALEKDPNFALAHLGMGYVWTYYASTGLMPAGEMGARVQESLMKAIEIDPTLAEAYETRGDYEFYYHWDWAAAERDYKRAVELKPTLVDMRLYYWELLAALKRMPEAEQQIRRCLELDPLNPYVQADYGLFLLNARRFDEAIAQFQKVLKAEMDFGPALLGLWEAYHHEGMQAKALSSAKEYFVKWGDGEMAGVLDEGFKKGGYAGAMRAGADALVERSKRTNVLAVQVATLFAYAGDKKQALDWLERAFDAHETGIVKLQVDPDWDGLRREERFQALVRRMRFPPAPP